MVLSWACFAGLQGAKIAVMIGSWSLDLERWFNSSIVSARSRG
jgi:hypothetical protein